VVAVNGHVVAFRVNPHSGPRPPVILRHPEGCDPADCPLGRKLADNYDTGNTTWVDGVYQETSPGSGAMARLSWWGPETFPLTDAEYLALLRPPVKAVMTRAEYHDWLGRRPVPTEAPAPGAVEHWPMWVHVESSWAGLRWEGRYGYSVSSVGRQVFGVDVGFVKWGRRGDEKLVARFVREHIQRFGPPPPGMLP
jgi:hypothetical protein